MHFVKIPEGRSDLFLQFMEQSMFTIEDINNDILNPKTEERKQFSKLFDKAAKAFGYTGKDLFGYYFNGELMNKVFGYTGENAYPDDLGFLVVPDLHIPELKLALGARWFDDIVSRNAIKQHAVDEGTDPDFQ